MIDVKMIIRAMSFVAALLALPATCANAEELPKMTTPRTPLEPREKHFTPDLPPLEYDHPYGGFLIIKRARLADIVSGRACTMFSVACAIPKADSCTIILPFESDMQDWLDHMEDPINLELFDELLRRHEIGHCNGWPQTHPNAEREED